MLLFLVCVFRHFHQVGWFFSFLFTVVISSFESFPCVKQCYLHKGKLVKVCMLWGIKSLHENNRDEGNHGITQAPYTRKLFLRFCIVSSNELVVLDSLVNSKQYKNAGKLFLVYGVSSPGHTAHNNDTIPKKSLAY